MSKSDSFDEDDKEVCQTNDIVCPYCGEEFQDCFEMPENDDACECYECDKKFSYQQDVSVTYTSQRDCAINGEKHEFIMKDLKGDGQKSWWCRKCPKLEISKPADDLIVEPTE